MSDNTKFVEAGANLVVLAIKDWMIKHPNELVPNMQEVLADRKVELTPSAKSNYTTYKRRAFKELKAAGYELSFLDGTDTVACLVDYKAPDAKDLLSGNVSDEFGTEKLEDYVEVVTKPPEMSPTERAKAHAAVVAAENKDKDKADTPAVVLRVNETMSCVNMYGIGKMVMAMSHLPPGTMLDVKLQISKSRLTK